MIAEEHIRSFVPPWAYNLAMSFLPVSFPAGDDDLEVDEESHSPDQVPEIRQRRLIYWIEPELGLRVDNDARVEPATSKHNGSLDVRILVQYVLYRNEKDI